MQTAVVVGVGGPLMRMIVSELVAAGDVSVHAVLTTAKGASAAADAGAWPAEARGGEGEGSLFELSTIEQPQRFAVQRATAGASCVFVCLVDGYKQEACLDETTAVRWVEGAGGGSGAPASPKTPSLPFPAAEVDTKGRLVAVVTSLGTCRAGQMPYVLQNVWGQLDSWRKVEQAAVYGSQVRGYDHAIAHLGKLTPDAPLSSAAAAEGPATVTVAPGDVLGGSVSVGVAADALARLARGQLPAARNATFSLISVGGGPGLGERTRVSASVWDDQFLKCVGPEVVRIGLSADADVVTTGAWLREFARGFSKSPNTLPTATQIVPVDGGVKIVFLKSGYEYSGGFDDDDKDDSVGGGGSDELERAQRLRGQPDGALLLLAEASPVLRVRAVRADMTEGVVVKEMSETAIITRLRKELPNQLR